MKAMAQIRQKLLPLYARTIFEIKTQSGWLPVPPAAIFRAVITAWNPDGLAEEDEDNLARDIHLKETLDAAGLKSYRARGRSQTTGDDGNSLWVEEGWLILNTDRGYILDLLYKYNQLGALILDGRDRSILWHDGVETPL